MASWPTSNDLLNWIGIEAASTSTITERLPLALAGALAVAKDDVSADLMPDDDTVPDSVRLATLILAHRLLVRPDSPTGNVGFAEYAYRVAADDPDYNRLMRHYMLPGIA